MLKQSKGRGAEGGAAEFNQGHIFLCQGTDALGVGDGKGERERQRIQYYTDELPFGVTGPRRKRKQACLPVCIDKREHGDKTALPPPSLGLALLIYITIN